VKVKLFRNYLPELAAAVSGRKKPLAVSLNITAKCNQRCIYCEIGKGISSQKSANPAFDNLKLLIDEMSQIGIKRLSINGGEPFLYDRIFDLIKYAGERNVECNITSNGMNIFQISQENISILKKYNTSINLSVDSLNEEIQNFTRGHKNASENVLKSAKFLIENGIAPTFLSAITSYNFKNLYDSLIEAKKLGIKTVLYQPIIYYSNYPDREVIDNKATLNIGREQIVELILELKKILKYEFSNGVKTNVYRLLPWIESYLNFVNGSDQRYFWEKLVPVFKCRDIYAIVDIAYDGEIQPCAFSSSGIYIAELKDKTLVELWLKAGSELRKLNENGNLPPFCNSCCNHFSRNMISSALRYPLRNQKVLIRVLLLSFRRLFSVLIKTLTGKR
jgi:MoaA/NifB/PqqE/SkfB family radical SAM enzyme